MTWSYTGYARSGGASTFTFSIDSGTDISFEKLECMAYDLMRDPDRLHPIRPLLLGPDGISKKISVPLLEPLESDQPFSLLLTCKLPRCITAGRGYYTSTLSFAQDRIRRCTVRLLFAGAKPGWVRVYDCTPPSQPSLVKNLVPARQEFEAFEYVDVIEDAPGQSVRVYMFWRDSV